MFIENKKGRARSAGLLSAILILAGTAAAQADGGFSQPYFAYSEGAATSDTATTVEAAGARYESRTFAEVQTGAAFDPANGFTEAWADALAGNFTTFVVEDGNARYDQQKSAHAEVYAKGDNVMAKARSENHVVIYIEGKAYVVIEELARALSRTSIYGTHSVATADTNISAESSGFLDVNTGTTTSATVRTQAQN